MKYFSTRGDRKPLSFEETVLAGLAPDGGLYIPEYIPSLPENWRTLWAGIPYTQLCYEILCLYIDPEEIPRDDLRAIVAKSYDTFRRPLKEVVDLGKLDEQTYLLLLHNGPTFAFKDVALQLLGNLFEYFLARRNAKKPAGEKPEKLTIVGATSGDTGSAAIYGLRGKENISIFILYPKGRISPIQEAQMTTVLDANVHNLAVNGTFDDCQDTVKTLFSDAEFKATHHLGAVNSINWARILAQTVYYVHASLELPADARLQFVVPTGNFGDVLAGYYAKRMGVKMERLVVATNSNDILARFWGSGAYDRLGGGNLGGSDGRQATGADGVVETLSPAMDILVSSNFERLLWYLAYESTGECEEAKAKACQMVDGWMRAVKSDGRVEVPVHVLELARRDFIAERVDDQETLSTIKSLWLAKPSFVIDPHTAVGVAAAKRIASLNPSGTIQIMLATAHPAKFLDAVKRALVGVEAAFESIEPAAFKGLLQKKRRVETVDKADVGLVKAIIERYAEAEAAVGGVAGV